MRHSRFSFGFPLERRERVLEIQVRVELAVDLLDGLREIHRVGERAQRIDGFRRDVRHAERRGFLQLEHRNAGVSERLQRRADVLVLDRLVADVVHHAEVPAQRGLGLRLAESPSGRDELAHGVARVQMVLEVVDGLLGGLEEAGRLGLERERDGAAGALLEHHHVRHDVDDVARELVDVLRGPSRSA